MQQSRQSSCIGRVLFLLSLSSIVLRAQSRTASTTISEQYLFVAANQARAERGLAPLHSDPLLTETARLHAHQMAYRHAISHQFSGEPDLAARAREAGVRFSLVTENVAEAPNSALIHELWMHSAGHRANLLDPKVDSLGVAVVAVNGQLYAVQDFAHIVERIPLAEQESRVATLLARAGLNLVLDRVDARQTCTLSSGYTGQVQPWFVMRYTTSDLSSLPSELSSKLSSGHFRSAAVGACDPSKASPFTSYSIAVLVYR